ncbi:hypothetical protein FA15DRAFT_660541 [Coprinopsis marcescibilis]|uniref:Uncharacterized protein n=1 Tax=Coprinopsis marcescibilis TaxID=230819 RepID=A0A5C3KF26_COPMA|nr:hypothetical protein FA15DRAFT_660541 [Coprinopsis marcescibilis]
MPHSISETRTVFGTITLNASTNPLSIPAATPYQIRTIGEGRESMGKKGPPLSTLLQVPTLTPIYFREFEEQAQGARCGCLGMCNGGWYRRGSGMNWARHKSEWHGFAATFGILRFVCGPSSPKEAAFRTSSPSSVMAMTPILSDETEHERARYAVVINAPDLEVDRHVLGRWDALGPRTKHLLEYSMRAYFSI